MKELGDSGFHGIVSQHAHTRMNDRYAILKEERERQTNSHMDKARLPFSVNKTCHTNKIKEL